MIRLKIDIRVFFSIMCAFTLFICIFLPSIFNQLNHRGLRLTFLHQGYRLFHVKETYDGLNLTGQYLTRILKYDQDHVFLPIESTGDDLGVYFLIPALMKHFNLNLETAYYLLCFIIIFTATLSGLYGLILLSGRPFIHFYTALTFTFLLFLNLYILDVYIVYFLGISMIPLCLGIEKRLQSHPHFVKLIFICYGAAGLVLSVCEFIRSYSGLGVVAFFFIFKLTQCFRIRNLTPVIPILVMYLVTANTHHIWMKYIQMNRDLYFQQHADIPYQLNFGPSNNQHLFWHPIYIGLSYIPNNPHGIIWDDRIA